MAIDTFKSARNTPGPTHSRALNTITTIDLRTPRQCVTRSESKRGLCVPFFAGRSRVLQQWSVILSGDLAGAVVPRVRRGGVSRILG